MNSVVLIGRLTKDGELRTYTDNEGMEKAYYRFTIAVDRENRAKDSDKADFIRIMVWGKQAENCNKYLAKGKMVGVKGKLQTGQYKDKEGKTVYTTDVIAERVEFLTPQKQDSPQEEFAMLNEDVPF